MFSKKKNPIVYWIFALFDYGNQINAGTRSHEKNSFFLREQYQSFDALLFVHQSWEFYFPTVVLQLEANFTQHLNKERVSCCAWKKHTPTPYGSRECLISYSTLANAGRAWFSYFLIQQKLDSLFEDRPWCILVIRYIAWKTITKIESTKTVWKNNLIQYNLTTFD